MSHADPQLADTDGSFMVTKCTACHFAAADVENWNIADTASANLLGGVDGRRARAHDAYPGEPGGELRGADGGPERLRVLPQRRHDARDATNPFRLANKGTVGTEADRWNQVCLVCHKTGDAGYDPDGSGANYSGLNGTRNVDDNHYGPSHTPRARAARSAGTATTRTGTRSTT